MESNRTSESDESRNLTKTTWSPPSLLSRIPVGGLLGYTVTQNLKNIDSQIGYVDSKGFPYPEKLVPFSSGMLAVGSLGLLLWRIPVVAAGAVGSFLVRVIPVMHDFWNEEDEQQAQVERYQFVKNTVILGAVIEFLRQGIKQH